MKCFFSCAQKYAESQNSSTLLKGFSVFFFQTRFVSVCALDDDSSAYGAVFNGSVTLCCRSQPSELRSPAVCSEVVVHDAGTAGRFLIRDVGSDEAVRVKPHIAHWMPGKQPPSAVLNENSSSSGPPSSQGFRGCTFGSSPPGGAG